MILFHFTLKMGILWFVPSWEQPYIEMNSDYAYDMWIEQTSHHQHTLMHTRPHAQLSKIKQYKGDII